MATDPDAGSSIKSYAYGNTIIIKYFDTGGSGLCELCCPHCHWCGEILAAKQRAGFFQRTAQSEFMCPECNTRLASARERKVANV